MTLKIKSIELTNKYCDENYILNRPCFLMWCKNKASYVKRLSDGRNVFHCKVHKTKEHLRIIP